MGNIFFLLSYPEIHNKLFINITEIRYCAFVLSVAESSRSAGAGTFKIYKLILLQPEQIFLTYYKTK